MRWLLCAPTAKDNDESKIPAIIIHGGAGAIKRSKMTSDDEKALRHGLHAATRAGYAVLAQRKGTAHGSALDAVECAVKSLEDNPLFNAGKGAVFNIEGKNQLEASVMDGSTGRAGAATLLTTVKHPVSLARRVMESSRHVFLGGSGADRYARDVGLEIVDPSYFWTRHRWEQHERGFLAGDDDSATLAGPADYSYLPLGTVGAVAVDCDGKVAAATSTGGMTNKWVGRIGDTPIIGAGNWADARVAVSGTGDGEYFIRQGTAHYIAMRMRLLGEGVHEASVAAIKEMRASGGDGGAICIDSEGNAAMTYCSEGMYRGYCSAATGDEPVVGIFYDETIAPGDCHLFL